MGVGKKRNQLFHHLIIIQTKDKVSSDPQCLPRGLDFCSPSPNLTDATMIVSKGSKHPFDGKQLMSTLKQAKNISRSGEQKGDTKAHVHHGKVHSTALQICSAALRFSLQYSG